MERLSVVWGFRMSQILILVYVLFPLDGGRRREEERKKKERREE
jgi:hypothetical protein